MTYSYEEDPEQFFDQVGRALDAIRAFRNGDIDGANLVLDGISPYWVIGFMLAFSVDYLTAAVGADGLTALINTHQDAVRERLGGTQT